MESIIYTSQTKFDKNNVLYSNPISVNGGFELDEVKAFDHTCCRFKDDRRSTDNFLGSDWVYGDVDNSHSDNPADWLTIEGFKKKFEKYSYYLLTSRNHLKDKDGKAPRPKFHVYFPLGKTIEKASTLEWLLDTLIRQYAPYFDPQVKDVARFFYASPDGEVTYNRRESIASELVKWAKQNPRQKKELVVPLDEIGQGNRNITLYDFGRQLKRDGLDEERIFRHLELESQFLGAESLSDKELRTIARSAFNSKTNVEPKIGDTTLSGLKIMNCESLLQKEIPEMKWAIEGLIPEGLSILAGPPKIGKSCLALEIAVAVAEGKAIFGVTIEKQKVYYLALEDSWRRLQTRLRDLKATNSDNLLMSIDFYRGEKAYEQLDSWLKDNPDVMLVIIDTLWAFANIEKGNDYSETYDAIFRLKKIADKHQRTFLINHHTKKTETEDFVSKVLGSQGLAGGADTILVLERKRNQKKGKLLCTGRDITEIEWEMCFAYYNGMWSKTGDAVEIAITEEKQAVVDLLFDRPDGLKITKIAELLKITYDAAKKRMQRMREEGMVIFADGMIQTLSCRECPLCPLISLSPLSLLSPCRDTGTGGQEAVLR